MKNMMVIMKINRFNLFVCLTLSLLAVSCDVEDPSQSLNPISNNLLPLGAEVIINEAETLTPNEVAEIKKFCLQAQSLQLSRFSSKLSYDFEYRKCATEDGNPFTVKFDVALAVLSAGQILIVKQDGSSVPNFFRPHNSHTSGSLGALCPTLLSGSKKDLNRFRKISESEYEAFFVSQGANCGSGVGFSEYCFSVQNLLSSGGHLS